MDPQHRLLCEYGYSALHHAGVCRAELDGSKAAIFLGMWPSDFGSVLAQRAESSALLATAGGQAIAAGRLSYVLNLNGHAPECPTWNCCYGWANLTLRGYPTLSQLLPDAPPLVSRLLQVPASPLT